MATLLWPHGVRPPGDCAGLRRTDSGLWVPLGGAQEFGEYVVEAEYATVCRTDRDPVSAEFISATPTGQLFTAAAFATSRRRGWLRLRGEGSVPSADLGASAPVLTSASRSGE